MIKILLVIALLSVTQGYSPSDPYYHFKDVYLGLIRGLSIDPLSPNACKIASRNDVDFESFINQVDSVIQDIKEILQFKLYSIQLLKKDYANLLIMLDPEIENCDFNGFFKRLKDEYSLQGLRKILNNLTSHRVEVLEDIDNLNKCQRDYLKCGESLGNLMKLIAGTGI